MRSFLMCGVLEFVTVNKNLKTWIKLMNSSRHCALYLLTYIWDELLFYQSQSSIIIFLHLSLHLWWFKLQNSQPRSDPFLENCHFLFPIQSNSKVSFESLYVLFWRKKILMLTPNSVSSFSNLTLYFCTVSRNLCICTYVLHKRALSQ